MATHYGAAPAAPQRRAAVRVDRTGIVFWIVVFTLMLTFTSFNPLASDTDLFAAAGAAGTGGPTSLVSTLLGYYRYAVLLACTIGLTRYALAGAGSLTSRATLAIVRDNLWLPAWAIILLPSILLSPAVQAKPVDLIVQILTLLAALFLILYLGSVRRTMRAIYYALIGCLVVSYLAVFFIPGRAIHTAGAGTVLNENLAGLWRGVFGHKNIAGGFFMELLVLSFTMMFAGGSRVLAASAFVGAAVFLYFAGSISSLFAPIAALAIFATVKATRLAKLLPELFATAYVAFPFLVAKILYRYGVSMDSRDLIWQVAIDYTRGASLFGHGYANGFGTRGMARTATAHWMLDIGHAHSGVMDSYVYFGVIGLACLWYMTRTVLRHYVTLVQGRGLGRETWYVYGAMLVYIAAVMRSFAEPDVLTPRGGWLVMVITGLLPSLHMWRMREADRRAPRVAAVQAQMQAAPRVQPQ